MDNASVWYNSGSGWTLLTASIKSNLCGGGQGEWTHYSTNLPASCDNNAAVKVGVNWVNNDDAAGTDPSVAINDLLVTGVSGGPPVLQTATATVTITEPAAIASTQTVTLCNGGALVVGTSTYTTAGTYTNVLTALNSCDSTVTKNLFFKPAIDTSTTVNGNTITSNATSATYQWIDCGNNDTIIPGETGQAFTSVTNANLAVIVTQDGCSDTSACIKINTTGVSLNSLQEAVFVFPNPASGTFSVKTATGEDLTVDIFDVNGRHVLNKKVGSRSNIDVSNLDEGLYILTIKTGGRSVTKKLSIVR